MNAYERECFEGRPELVRQARRFVSRALVNAGVPSGVIGDAVTCVSELATNAVEHTASGRPGAPGGRASAYEVRVIVDGAQVRVEVADEGAAKPPPLSELSAVPADAESGRGLYIVGALGRIYAGESAQPNSHYVGVVLELVAADAAKEVG